MTTIPPSNGPDFIDGGDALTYDRPDVRSVDFLKTKHSCTHLFPSFSPTAGDYGAWPGDCGKPPWLA